jgi:ADP-ribose pyrophosphatase YjhB (NUDIX family)
MNPKWLKWAAEMQSIAQAGLTFSENKYDLDRYEQLRKLAIEIMNDYTGVPHKMLKDLFANETGYQTPKVDIRSAVFRDGKILLVKEKIDGKWSLPGGWADVNTTVGESAIRECLEEGGATVVPERIIALLTADRHHEFAYPYTVYKIFVQCRLVELNFIENTETDGSEFFRKDELPELSAERNTLEQVEMCFNAGESEMHETLFD